MAALQSVMKCGHYVTYVGPLTPFTHTPAHAFSTSYDSHLLLMYWTFVYLEVKRMSDTIYFISKQHT